LGYREYRLAAREVYQVLQDFALGTRTMAQNSRQSLNVI
jgi:hypothetical protein